MAGEKRQIKFIVRACRWFDKVNGNTYHSVRITRCSDSAQIGSPLTYGYGDAYRQTALSLMLKEGWITGYTDTTAYNYERDNNYPIYWDVVDTTLRETKLNGEV